MSEIAHAVKLLKEGRLVAFPTETVYGLGADATSATAVARIYAAKGRPSTNPLIVHVADVARAKRYAGQWPERAQALAEKFWPGPLTLVVPKASVIVNEATAGLDTVALRAPDHPLALELLDAFDGAVAAPSANRSTRISPTTAQHVRDEMGDAVDLVLDGGASSVGIESTVLDLTGGEPKILRPGSITRGQIEAVVGCVREFVGHVERHLPAASPGQHEVHYAPVTPAFRFDSSGGAPPETRGSDAMVVLGDEPGSRDQGRVTVMPRDPAAYARQLYAVLRRIDAIGAGRILIEMPPDRPEWAAVRDRLMRAARPLAR